MSWHIHSSVRFFFFYCSRDHRYLHVLTHSFPTRRSSDLSISVPDFSASACICFSTSGVRTHPGQMALQVTPLPAFSRPVTLVSPTKIGRAQVGLQSLMSISYAVFRLKKKKYRNIMPDYNTVTRCRITLEIEETSHR